LTSNVARVTIERASCKLATPHPVKSIEVTMSAAFHFLEVLVVSVAALVALALLLLVIVAHLPGSPLKDILAAVFLAIYWFGIFKAIADAFKLRAVAR
jgi:hypothetical protein